MFYVINFTVKNYKTNNIGYIEILEKISPLNWFMNNMPEGTRATLITRPSLAEAELLKKQLQNLKNYGKRRKADSVGNTDGCEKPQGAAL